MDTSSSALVAGVDTGGTYTDAVLIDGESRRVAAAAKALTTRGDLALGVNAALRRALEGLEPAAARRIRLVAVSTTLATNAVVEGHGSPIAVILIGFDRQMAERSGLVGAFPGMPIEHVAGGHDHNGEAVSPLDEAALRQAIERHRGTVEAFAVAAAFAVRNPAHEQRARALIVAMSGRPVTLSSELTSALDAPRRALTAALNARLIPRISSLIAAVGQAMEGLQISAPLMITRGDGTLALAEQVKLRPIETVLSGPAASLVGAAALSGLKDFILTDMGGTTTDLGILENGRPIVNERGAEIGGWRTMVRAIDVKTLGLGGDSQVGFGLNGAMTIGPERAVPVSLIGESFPAVIDELERELADPEALSGAGRFVMRPLGSAAGAASRIELTAREGELMALIGEVPKPMRRVAVSSGAQRSLAALARKGLVQIAGLTPSDAAHVLGLQDNWSREAALKAALLAARARSLGAASADAAEALSREIWSETVRLSAKALLDVAIGAGDRALEGAAMLIDAGSRGQHRVGLADVRLKPAIPVVAVGGPVKVYHPEAARRLGCAIVFPEHWAVANAVGAASGVVARSVTIAITGEGAGAFRVHLPDGVMQTSTAREALMRAETAARRLASEAALAMGATMVEVSVRRDLKLLPDAVDDNGMFDGQVTAEAIGRPL
jgi:N-methylhydantoinase A/oxoprolinase/acetone carboxylase beta subunit